MGFHNSSLLTVSTGPYYICNMIKTILLKKNIFFTKGIYIQTHTKHIIFSSVLCGGKIADPETPYKPSIYCDRTDSFKITDVMNLFFHTCIIV